MLSRYLFLFLSAYYCLRFEAGNSHRHIGLICHEFIGNGVPRALSTNGPSSSNSAGGSIQFSMFVQYFQATSGGASVSTECAISQAAGMNRAQSTNA